MASSLEALRAEVLGRPECTACGACVGLCPYIVAVDDHVASAGSCRIDGGRCYRYCPRTGGDGGFADPGSEAAPGGEAETAGPGPLAASEGTGGFAGLGGDAGFAGPIGRVAATYLVRAVSVSGAEADDPEPRDVDSGRHPAAAPRPPQHGGAVSALLRQALREGLVRSAILTEDSGAGSPRAVLAATEAEVDACRGSKFAVTPVVAAVNRALAEGHEAVGVVALPCQATALARMRAAGADVPVLPGGVSPAAGVSLVIGLFCTWALEQEGWSRLARERLGPGPYRRVDIPPPPAELLVAEAADGSRSEAPLAEVRVLVRPGCRVCMDMTAENADVSVGMAETEPGWNTLMVRTPVGEALLAGAVAAGVLELRPTSEEGMAHLEAASLGKKRRAAAEADARVVGGKAAGARDQGSPYLARVASWKAES